MEWTFSIYSLSRETSVYFSSINVLGGTLRSYLFSNPRPSAFPFPSPSCEVLHLEVVCINGWNAWRFALFISMLQLILMSNYYELLFSYSKVEAFCVKRGGIHRAEWLYGSQDWTFAGNLSKHHMNPILRLWFSVARSPSAYHQRYPLLSLCTGGTKHRVGTAGAGEQDDACLVPCFFNGETVWKVTVDGSEILRTPVEAMVVYPIIHSVFYIRAICFGFLNHQQYKATLGRWWFFHQEQWNLQKIGVMSIPYWLPWTCVI